MDRCAQNFAMAIIILWQREEIVVQAEDAPATEKDEELFEEPVVAVVDEEGEGRPKQVCTSTHSHSPLKYSSCESTDSPGRCKL